MFIYHIVLPETWEKFKDEKFYEAESLRSEGFIHCSFAEQVETVLRRYYKDAAKVLILTIKPEKLTSQLVNESSTGGEIYPHVYGEINREAIVGIEEKEIGRG
ncbi:MAG: DUF952 domain-containing protein [Acidobacteriota bacterium]|nr:DUF952 domain-containing protein [Acidobacteriota bacterium]